MSTAVLAQLEAAEAPYDPGPNDLGLDGYLVSTVAVNPLRGVPPEVADIMDGLVERLETDAQYADIYLANGQIGDGRPDGTAPSEELRFVASTLLAARVAAPNNLDLELTHYEDGWGWLASRRRGRYSDDDQLELLNDGAPTPPGSDS